MINDATIALLASIFFAIAALYAAAGFGGGSSYLAILALYLKDFLAVKTVGLLCNLVVVSGGTYLFRKGGYFDRAKFLPIALSGVPMAFFGATIHLRQHVFFTVLGCVLSLAGLLLLLQIWLRPPEDLVRPRSFPLWMLMLLGGGIGLLSGLVGIGGGILLSPALNLARWDRPKKIAALASFFILLNSVAGLAGQLVSGTFKFLMPLTGILMAAVFLGGQLGTRLSIRAIRPAVVKGLTGVLVCYIGLKLVLKYTNGADI
jgi:uncharacterized membrane protein YfcA